VTLRKSSELHSRLPHRVEPASSRALLTVLPAAPQSQPRLASLDAFRGLTIVGMLLVNNVALDKATPQQLVHAGWNQGVHVADLVFPWFLLIVGLSIPLSQTAQDFKRILGRSAVLVFLGCVLDSSYKGYLTFDLGVLQLIGLSYGAAALCSHLSQRRRLGIAFALLLTHWAVLRGYGAFAPDDNFVLWLNQTYLQHFYLEGLFSAVSTTGLVLIGTVFGDALRREDGISNTEIAYLFFCGAALAAMGWLWNLDQPFSKSVWTASYLAFSGGLGLMAIAAFRLVIDMHHWRAWAWPLNVFGANAITVYVAPILLKTLVLQKIFVTMPNGAQQTVQQAMLGGSVALGGGRVAGGWIYTLSYIMLWWLVLLLLYRRRIFLRV
jgi:predicted acyltransferase